MTNPLMNITIPGSLVGSPTGKALGAKSDLRPNATKGNSQTLEDLKGEEIVIPEEKSFWSKKKVLMGLLLLGAMFGTLLALFSGSRGGSGSSGGGPGGSGGPGSGPPSSPDPRCVDDNNCPCVGDECPKPPPGPPIIDTCPGSNCPPDDNDGIPVNPEPSTFLLMGAGFALALLRRKKA
ncbi:MAG: PEP-CTERM sorting domain-containing protein [Candidatus Omnitrophica bacterium]|nr:PEP-CTERM sorting domain-containing protein [Candidatus Omnitrophota bacterium]